MNTTALVRTLLLLVCALPLLLPPPARAQAAVSLTVTPAFEGNYVPGTWLPVDVRISNGGPAANVSVSASLLGSRASYVQALELPGGAEKQITLYVDMDQSTRELTVAVIAGGEPLVQRTVAVRPRADERMLGIVAGQELALSLPRRQDLAQLPFTVLKIAPADLPDRAAGLGGLGLLLLQGLPADGLSQAQIDAMLAWVSAGGHLFIGGGQAAAGVAELLPAELRAATIGEATQLADAPLAALVDGAGPGELPAVRLAALPGGVSAGPPAAPAWVARPLGKGLITQLAFDPGLPALRNWPAAPLFWDKLLQPALLVSTPFGLQNSVDSIQESILAGALTALPTVSQPPTDAFFLILIVYAVLVGPGVALALRRIDRQTWSWLIVPVAAVGCGALLLTLALNLRADQRLINQISLVEYLGGGQARARTFVGLLAPQPQTLAAAVPADALARPLRSASGLYGAIDGVVGSFAQQSAELPLAVEAWKLQGVLVEQQLPVGDISAEIAVGGDGANVTARNMGDQRLRDVVIVYGEQLVRLGDLRPGEQASAHWPPNVGGAATGAALSSLILAESPESVLQPGQARERQAQIREALISAAAVRDISATEPGPLLLAWMERSPLDIALDAPQAARQSTTLLLIRPQIRGSGAVDLPAGWLRLDPRASQREACFGDAGAGVSAGPSPATIIMRLPDDLSPLRAERLSLTLDSSEPWPSAGVKTELYDWAAGRWVERDFDGPGVLEVPEPAAFVSEGRLQIRISGPIERAGCLAVSANLDGSLP